MVRVMVTMIWMRGKRDVEWSKGESGEGGLDARNKGSGMVQGGGFDMDSATETVYACLLYATPSASQSLQMHALYLLMVW